MNALHVLALALAAFPAALYLVNLLFYRPPPLPGPTVGSGFAGVPPPQTTPVSVLIPARNEEDAIGPALEAVLANPDPAMEVLVLDDHSTDRTASRVDGFAARDSRVRRLSGAELPGGWCGKQHACWQLALAARHPILVFLDADVRLAPDAVARLRHFLDQRPGVHLASGVPRQQTGTFLERLLIPLIHFILLGYLPLPAARLFRWSAFAAGCGQLFVARREAYFACGGHRAIRATLHDGVKLPRAFRGAGFGTDLFDATPVATCRMYQSGVDVWRGLGKNATEGLGHPAAIGPWTFLLLGGQVLPWLLLARALALDPVHLPLSGAAVVLGMLPRLLGVLVHRQSLVGAILHPLGILLLVAIQWQSLARQRLGRPMEWRGRAYPAPGPRARTALP